ncbi:MAG: hypothetical protein EOP06_10095 [Proteobacteria bacterium]|nr:MAG: hypothetical protein EOP06_10095 [Pseudomonadota bacterium]
MRQRARHLIQKFKQLFKPAPFESGLYEIFGEMRRCGSIDDRATWLEHLGQWLAKDSQVPGRYTRFKFLIQQLERDPELKIVFKNQLEVLSSEASLLRLFLQTGFSGQSGLLQEAGRRLASQIVPAVRENDFFEISQEIFRSDRELRWFAEMPPEIVEQLHAKIFESDSLVLRLQLNEAVSEALLVFTTHLSDLGLTNEIRKRSHHHLPSKSPFLKLHVELQKLQSSDRLLQRNDNSVPALISECQKVISQVYDDMEQNGTSIGLVYRLEVMVAALKRIQLLLNLLQPLHAPIAVTSIHALFSESIEATYSSRSVISHVHQQTHFLSRKIAERNGESGDHYIARGNEAKRTLFYSALKGGAIVVAMTITKLTLHSWHLPSLLDATAIWFVYTAGFLTMQFTDSTLATKLPSFTASKLARLMTTVRTSAGLDKMASELKAVLISQTLALVGNLIAVIPIAALLAFTFERIFGSPIISTHTSENILLGLHPLFSLAIPLGALTGILLWISSLAGGWFENWVVFRQIPTAVAQHRRFNRLFGKSTAEKTAHWLEHHASGISANVTLGFLFGFVPFLGFVTGLPLDSKHVTISSASAALSALTLRETPHLLPSLLWSVAGLVTVGVANLIVSFSLALYIAARASSIKPRRFQILVNMLLRRTIGRR